MCATRRGLLGASSQAVHLLAAGAWAGAWVGGVAALAMQPQRDLCARAGRFSKPGYAMASMTPIASLAMLALIDGAFTPRVATAYGWLAAAKIVLFLALLTLAAANRSYALARANVLALRAGILAELVVMATLSLTAATLASTSPAM